VNDRGGRTRFLARRKEKLQRLRPSDATWPGKGKRASLSKVRFVAKRKLLARWRKKKGGKRGGRWKTVVGKEICRSGKRGGRVDDTPPGRKRTQRVSPSQQKGEQGANATDYVARREEKGGNLASQGDKCRTEQGRPWIQAQEEKKGEEDSLAEEDTRLRKKERTKDQRCGPGQKEKETADCRSVSP